MSKKLKRKILFISTLFLVFCGVLIYQYFQSKDLEENGIKQKASITYFRYFNYISDEMTSKQVRFLRINYSYQLDEDTFFGTEDLSYPIYQKEYFKQVSIGDSISILVSKDSPNNSKIITK